MTSKHTPGPWHWSDGYQTLDGRPSWTLLSEKDGYGILCCDGEENSPQGLNDEANARLIAAAPELYAAVAAVIGAVRDYLPPDGIKQDEFINRVIAATDNPQIVAALQQIES